MCFNRFKTGLKPDIICLKDPDCNLCLIKKATVLSICDGEFHPQSCHTCHLNKLQSNVSSKCIVCRRLTNIFYNLYD